MSTILTNNPKIHKHICNRCKFTYYTLGSTTPSSCPIHYDPNSPFNILNYTKEESIQLSKLRENLVGKTISVDDGLIIITEVLDIHSKTIEFIVMPSHRIYTTTLDNLCCYIPILCQNQNS